MSEKFCLKWNDFHSNASKSFSVFRDEDYLHDVTLVTNDHNKIAAHKLVLSACSDYFKDIFKNNQHSHPLLCLDGISIGDLTNIMDYIYNGEVQIYQDNLDRFLSLAQRLKLEGLMGNDDKEETFEANPNEDPKYDNIEAAPEIKPISTESKRIPRQKIDNSVAPVALVADNIGKMSEINEKVLQYLEKSPEGKYYCTLCNHTNGLKSAVVRHIETHIDGLVYTCHVCEKTFRSRNSMISHKSKSHK